MPGHGTTLIHHWLFETDFSASKIIAGVVPNTVAWCVYVCVFACLGKYNRYVQFAYDFVRKLIYVTKTYNTSIQVNMHILNAECDPGIEHPHA